MPLNLKAINAELAKRGCKATLAKGEGYFYFQGGDATDWLDRTVRVATLHSLSLEQWIGHYRELKAKNETLLKVQIKSKERETRRTPRLDRQPPGIRRLRRRSERLVRPVALHDFAVSLRRSHLSAPHSRGYPHET